MKKIFAILILFVVIIQLQSCTDDFTEMNQDPNGLATIEDAQLFLLPMLIQGYTDSYQVCTNLYHDLYSQHWANLHPGFDTSYYGHTDKWITRRWKQFYVSYVGNNFREIKDIAEVNPEMDNVYHVARIWYAFLTSQMVDTWGDIPYSEANKGGSEIPYDRGSDIYADLLNELKEAVAGLSNSADQKTISPTYDPIFGGNIESWKLFGNTIRARLALRTVNVNASNAKDEFVDAFNGGMILENSQNALQPCDGVTWYNYFLYFSQWTENGLSKTLEGYLKNTSSVIDPRLALWFQKSGEGFYNGIANGDVENASKNTHKYSTGNQGYFKYDCPYVAALASDSKFMLAEAALRGWIGSSSDAEVYFKEGIELNMQFWGQDYVGEEPSLISADEIDAYINGLPTLAGSKEEQLEMIITQRWLGNFTNGIEGWAIFRRTDYPKFQPILHNISTTVPNGSFIKRILYVASEHDNNPAVPVDPEGDSQNKRIFWDTSDDMPQNF
ncbi:MAG: SusD/RagB family nutrient-binding outer membrane lipoprotein [Carboxylicivirga sp.]|jgi:hypothetical protein|nr:SusD/RagB family nutrient-binding outer membrane lipoprotein [Carboxylicivirga sp.]